MNDRIADTRQCPYCRAWIEMPLRRQREAFEAHKLRCRAEDAEVAGYPTFCTGCHEPRNSAELNHAGTCRECLAKFWKPDPDERAFMDTVKDRLESAMTIKRADLWGNVIDTFATETELNGWRASQGALL